MASRQRMAKYAHHTWPWNETMNMILSTNFTNFPSSFVLLESDFVFLMCDEIAASASLDFGLLLDTFAFCCFPTMSTYVYDTTTAAVSTSLSPVLTTRFFAKIFYWSIFY